MARRFIDGMAVVTSENVGVDIVDALYGDDAGTMECSTLIEFDSAQKEYQSAQVVKTLEFSEGFRELMKMATEADIQARQNENNYVGVDPIRITMLRQARICTGHTLDFVRSSVEHAASVPRPVFIRE
jgi:hypothetical protein